MTGSNGGSAVERWSVRCFSWLREEMGPALFRRRVIAAAVIAAFLAAVFWLFLASDRYVSEARVIVQRTDLSGSQAMDFSSLLSAAATGGRADQLLLRDHLRSMDMLQKLDRQLNLRQHFSDSRRDPVSRMWFEDAPLEWLHRYYLDQVVSIELDEYAGILVITAKAYDASTANAIATLLVLEGERFMNDLAHRLADDQVEFLERQVARMNEQVVKTRLAVLNYQNRKGLVSPPTTAQAIAGIVAKLQAMQAELEAQRSAMQAYLVPGHSSIVQLEQQLAAVKKQIAQEQARLASSTGSPLNLAVQEFERLEMEAAFALDVYKAALGALEKGRVEATRTIKKVSVVQKPTEPEYPLEPRRLYNTIVFAIVAFLLAGVAQLLLAIVRDHKD